MSKEKTPEKSQASVLIYKSPPAFIIITVMIKEIFITHRRLISGSFGDAVNCVKYCEELIRLDWTTFLALQPHCEDPEEPIYIACLKKHIELARALLKIWGVFPFCGERNDPELGSSRGTFTGCYGGKGLKRRANRKETHKQSGEQRRKKVLSADLGLFLLDKHPVVCVPKRSHRKKIITKASKTRVPHVLYI